MAWPGIGGSPRFDAGVVQWWKVHVCGGRWDGGVPYRPDPDEVPGEPDHEKKPHDVTGPDGRDAAEGAQCDRAEQGMAGAVVGEARSQQVDERRGAEQRPRAPVPDAEERKDQHGRSEEAQHRQVCCERGERIGGDGPGKKRDHRRGDGEAHDPGPAAKQGQWGEFGRSDTADLAPLRDPSPDCRRRRAWRMTG